MLEELKCKLYKAIRARTNELLAKNAMSRYKLMMKSKLNKKTIDAVVSNRGEAIQMRTIQKIAIGFRMGLKEFFDSELFVIGTTVAGGGVADENVAGCENVSAGDVASGGVADDSVAVADGGELRLSEINKALALIRRRCTVDNVLMLTEALGTNIREFFCSNIFAYGKISVS